MIRRLFRLMVWLGVLGAIGYALWKLLGPVEEEPTIKQWQPLSAPAEVEPKPAAERAAPTWVDPEGSVCPASHPIKAKMQSKIFHVPGGQSYDRTTPERCYASPAAAEADGFRQAKR